MSARIGPALKPGAAQPTGASVAADGVYVTAPADVTETLPLQDLVGLVRPQLERLNRELDAADRAKVNNYLDSVREGSKAQFMLDFGYTPEIVLRNADLLDIDPAKIVIVPNGADGQVERSLDTATVTAPTATPDEPPGRGSSNRLTAALTICSRYCKNCRTFGSVARSHCKATASRMSKI